MIMPMIIDRRLYSMIIAPGAAYDNRSGVRTYSILDMCYRSMCLYSSIVRYML